MPVLLKKYKKKTAYFRNYIFSKGKNIRTIQSKCLFE